MARQKAPRHDLISDDGDFLRAKLKKLLLYRLILALFFLLLTVAITLIKNEDILASRLHPLYLFSCILFIFTIIGAYWLNRANRLVRFAWLQLLFDISAVSVLVFLSGGVESPFAFLFALVIISSALLLHRRASLLTASACSLAYGLLLDLQYFGWISPLQIVAVTLHPRDTGTYFFNLLTHIAGFYLIAFLAGYLAGEVLKSSIRARDRERDLSRLSTLHESIVESMTSGLLTIDCDGRVVFLNKSGREILELWDKDVNGRPSEEILPGIDLALCLAPVPADLGSHPHRMEIHHELPSRGRICLGYNVSLLHGEGKEPFGSIIIFQDLTEVKAIEERMQRVERLAFAGKIAAEIAHEIKNPLAAMSGSVQMLRQDSEKEAYRSRLLGIVEREIDRVNELVTDFLWLAKGPPKSEHVENVHICAAIREILSLLKSKKQISESHSIITEFAVYPTIRIDPHNLRQILWNILINAVEAMPEGGELCVSVGRLEKNGDGACLAKVEIRDTGCGMTESVRQRIFDPFFTTKGSGTGLGLSIVYQLVEKAGGRIEANPNPTGRGMIFSVFFPTSDNF